MSISPRPRPIETLAERFWSLARAAENDGIWDGAHERDPVTVARRVLVILDAVESDQRGAELTRRTVSFLTLLRQHEASGDLSYASPEQARGDQVDERSLVFSVGVLIFEQLTGRHPFGSTDGPRRVARIQRGELGSGVQFFPQVPPELRAVLMRAMGPFPEERYRSLAELRAELAHFAGLTPSQPAAPRPAPAPLRAVAAKQLDVSDEDPSRPVRVLRVDESTSPRHIVIPSRAPSPWGERVLCAALGALFAFAVMIGMQIGRARTVHVPRVVPAAAPPAPATRPTAAVAPAPVVLPVPPAPTAKVERPPLEAPPPVFDAPHVGELAARTLHACFAGRPLAAFGVGALFVHGDARARRAYLSRSEPLSAGERRCVVSRLVGLDVGTAPAASQVVELRLKLRGDGTHEVHTSIAPP